ncbi:hypothetical protein SPRG_18907 [Saprolegnia parasitica CBS 223.65]|uniref:PUM-HD domain-containing protein n=1 Tax=Saprolegnia parasitica (strain CBS 223.65) TaxID=695850 RepID=A0A067D2Q5_SAPPC|nr:hypothetical protein SPRG_18907 [Saprolegnia parasitica CBS 223.65]KDO35765.1 hypothetical protein SPRG_18907 [Saprolegnia parasitica CBS 223.65]|eukprot:XP_012194120.1 hypothetical protein SPRG_18907 [Saprolegnia parasitica CBS 223.65]
MPSDEMLPFDMSLLDLQPPSKQQQQAEPEFSKNYAIGSRIQRSMSAPPVAEHVGRLPPPMYAQSEYDDNQTEAELHPEYYYYYAPKSHNPRLPMSYNAWESMHKQYHTRHHHSSSLHRVQIPDHRDAPPAYTTSMAPKASQEDFEAAVAAAGGHTYQKTEPFCSSPTDSNHGGSVRPVNKTLIDRIQEDFPRTPSPVFGYGMTSEMEEELHRAGRYADCNNNQQQHHHELPSDFLHSMKRFPASREKQLPRINIVSPQYYPMMYAGPPPGLHYGVPPSHPGMVQHPMYERVPRGMYPSGYEPEYGMYHEPEMSDRSHYPDIRHLKATSHEYPSSRGSPPGYSRSRGFSSSAKSFTSSSASRHQTTQQSQPHNEAAPKETMAKPRVALNPKEACFEPRAAQPVSSSSSSEKRLTDKTKVAPTSVLLNDFRNTNKHKKWELLDARGHMVEFAKDQHGSRFIQQKLETAKADIKDIVFAEIYPVALTLMTDVFGNYVIQKFFDFGTSHHLSLLLRTISGRVLELALQMYGCRVIQKALELKNIPEKLHLISELTGHVLKCVKDQNGNHVVQKCIEILPWKTPVAMDVGGFILSAFLGNVYSLATHPYGCRVIQRVLEHCTEAQMAPILKEIHDCCCLLVEDQYGNYVIQHVLEHGQPSERSQVINKVYPDIVRFSYHKFASNVIEKCLMYASVHQLHVIVAHVMEANERGECPLQVMMKDQYANYVVQKLIDVADAEERERMVVIIKTQASHLKRFNFGKHILNRLEKLTGQKIA